MARLPIPGQDEGTWGEILNEFLTQALAADGSLKPGVVDAAAITDTTVTEAKLSTDVQTKLNTVAPVTSVNTQTGDVVLTKSDVGLGNADNTSDANKPVSAATQTALDAKANISHTHAAADVASGTLDIARIPTGTTNVTVALGNHAHTGTYLPIKNGTSSLTDSTNDKFARVDITDDTSPTSGWPDRLAFYFDGTRTGYHNEYGELRARPAKASTVALRAMYFGSGTANIFEVAPNASGAEYFAVSSTAASLTVPLDSTQDISTTGTVSGSNIGAKVTASSSAPSSPATGDVWIDLSS
ncbi:MAG TPA: hypothetical protein PK096_02535 [Candidatus Saccharibacteria bacterium]|nr:hypothetical protein [Candidatus Saccharibacteria bacterium]HRK94221.1 hypothetical protein [Candidatus Saccharibacteria bacterium]